MRGRTATLVIALLGAACGAFAAGPLPLGEIPPGKRLMVIQPHHDDHSWQYGFAGLIAKMVDAGYQAVFVRVSNDEKDGGRGWGGNDIGNYEDTLVATKHLGLDEVISLNWRNDHMDSIPHIELRDQLIMLIRKYPARRRDVVQRLGQLRPQPRPPQSGLGGGRGGVAGGTGERASGSPQAAACAASRAVPLLFAPAATMAVGTCRMLRSS